MDSSVDAGHVRFEVAVIESKFSKHVDKGIRFAGINKGFDKGVRFAGVDNNFMSGSFEKGLIDKMSCLCCDSPAATPTVTPMLESHSRKTTTTVPLRRSTFQRPKRSDERQATTTNNNNNNNNNNDRAHNFPDQYTSVHRFVRDRDGHASGLR